LRGGPFAQADFVGSWEAGFFGADAVTDLLILSGRVSRLARLQRWGGEDSRTEWKTVVFWRIWMAFFLESWMESGESSSRWLSSLRCREAVDLPAGYKVVR